MERKSYRNVRIAAASGCLLWILFCFFVEGARAARLMFIQPGPLFVKLTSAFSWPALLGTGIIFFLTFLCGRYFCAALCPLGVTQDVIGFLRENSSKNLRRKYQNIPNMKALRYGIAALVYILLAGGVSIGFRLLDPFSLFGGITSASANILALKSSSGIRNLLPGLLSLAVLICVVVWKRRIFCTAVCPIGTLLGLCARHGLYQLRMDERCSACGLCETKCPTGCINSQSRVIDNEICVRCMNCISFCPRDGIKFSRHKTVNELAGTTSGKSRRAFIIKGSALAIGILAAGHALGGTIREAVRRRENYKDLVFPPEALNSERFARICTSCQLCAVNCPPGIIESTRLLGPVHLDYDRSGCKYDCALCSDVCPSGALKRVAIEEKQLLRIGESILDTSLCRVVKENISCDLCAKECPKNAIFFIDNDSGLKVPEVNTYHCIGCGACQAICPARPKAIKVIGIEQNMMGPQY